MLELRVLTAAVLAPLFVLAVFKLPAGWFALLLALLVLPGAWEWTGLSGYPGRAQRAAGTAAAGLLMAAAYHFHVKLAEPLFIVTCVAWLVVSAALLQNRSTAPLNWPETARWLSGAWVLVPAWLAVSELQRVEPAAALMLFLLVWSADSAAYFAGRSWGRRRLAPAISPGKTIEGMLGALAAALVVAAVFLAWWRPEAGMAAGLALWSFFVVLVSIAGDLFESNWKRLGSVKDSGSLLPGHGGVLDRIDSMTAAAPFFALGWLWWFGSITA
ncbi:MAG TPA: phosphatidate cytidylyltransferase [Arenicellales bacterium]|nr:phosphatidate cytidylyltransferase [Arenicellales bacterium]